MKTLVKLSAGLMAVGFVLAMVGGFLGGFRAVPQWNPWHLGTGSRQESALEDGTTFAAVDVDISAGDVILSTGNACSASMSWNGNGYALTAQVEDGTLMVRSQSKGNGLGNLKNVSSSVHITVPQGEALERVSIHTGMGDVSLSDVSVSGTLQVNTDMGDIEGRRLSVQGGATWESNMGDLTIQGDFPCDLTVTSDMGDLELTLTQPKSVYTVSASTSMGDVAVDGKAVSGHSYDQSGGSWKLTATSDMGDVSLNFG